MVVSRPWLISGIVALGLGVASLAWPTASAQSPEPTVSPSPTPYSPQSSIHIRFVKQGQPVQVVLAAPLHRIVADGVVCSIPVSGGIVVRDMFSINWPLQSAGIEPPCAKGPPVDLRIEFIALDQSGVPLPAFAAEFRWTGGDVAQDLEVPPNAAAASTSSTPPTPTSSTPSIPTSIDQAIVTPAVFPATGGSQPVGDTEVMTLAVLLLFGTAMTAVFAMATASGGSRD
jgi:hypothetical protein